MLQLPRARLRQSLQLPRYFTARKHKSWQPLLLTRHYAPYPKEGVFQPNSPPHPGLNQEQPGQQNQTYQYTPSPQQEPPNDQANSRINYRRIFVSYVFSAIAFSVGWVGIRLLMEQRLPQVLDAEPGSEEDLQILQELYDELAELQPVQQLRDEIIVEDGKRKPAFREWMAYQGFDKARKELRLTTGPLGGYNGLAAQFVFWCEQTKELYIFLTFGPKTCGWPGVVHGGAIATICDEALGRHAILTTEEKSAVTAQLEVKYEQTIEPGTWFMVAVKPNDKFESTDKKKFVLGQIFCVGEEGPFRAQDGSWDGATHIHCEAKGLFVVPKGVPLSPLPDDF